MTAFVLTSGIAMAVLLAVYYLLLQREKMHRFNRFYLIGSLVFSLAVPFISIPVYKEVSVNEPVADVKPVSLTVEAQELPQYITPRLVPATSSAATHPIDYTPFIWGLYGMGVMFFALRFVLNIVRLYGLVHKNEKITNSGSVLVLLNDCPIPYTFMQYIFLNKSVYNSGAIELELLAHETAHVKQRHTLDILFIETIKTLLWFNPFVYAYKHAIQLNHEFLADEKTLNQFNNIPTYQQMLLAKATPHSNHLLASSITFSVTKKRFLMMTKTTSAVKSIVLKTAMLPVVAGLLYFLSAETVTYAKPANGNAKIITTTPVNTLIPEALATVSETPQTTPALTDTVVGNTRRDEYFKGVRIIIEDKLRNVHIDTPYEKLALEHKLFYLNDVPEKKMAKPVSKEDYDFQFSQKPEETTFYIDEKKVTREEVLKYKREDFVNAGFRAQGTQKPGGGMKQEFQMFLFTRSFFEKNMKHLNDHYPDAVYTINITIQPVDTNTEGLAEDNKRDASGKTAYQREEEAKAEKLKAESFDYIGEYVETSKNISAQYPGGDDAFDAYVDKNIKLPDAYKNKKINVSYIINTDGTLSEISCDDVDEATEKQIIRVFLASARWIPFQKNGKAVKMNTNYRFKS